MRNVVFALVALVSLTQCSDEKLSIRSACEIDKLGNYVIKWETYPPTQGSVQIYESNSPDTFNTHSPIAEVPISKGYTTLMAIRNMERSYFHLVFNKKYKEVVTERSIILSSVFNFRDIGGYHTRQNKQMRWGKIYRTSSLFNLNHHDHEYLRRLGIKTIIDLRNEFEYYNYPSEFQAESMINLPLKGDRLNVYFDKVLSGELTRNDVIVHLQGIFYSFIDNNPEYFRQLFDILLDKSNYPIVISCSLGKDRSALATALILAALDVSHTQVVEDYMYSNEQINFQFQFPNAQDFGPAVQETMTALYSAHEEIINNALDRIEEKYGSVHNYLEEELRLTAKDREKLRELLLY